MDESRLKAFDFAQEVAKQLISLATAIVALTITFLHDIVHPGVNGEGWLEAAWVLYVVSVPLGVATMMTLAGNLEKKTTTTPSIYAGNVRFFGLGQVFAFALALIFTTVFGFEAAGTF